MADIRPPALHQMSGQLAPNALSLGAVDIRREVEELLIQETQQRPKGAFVAAVGRGGDEHDMSIVASSNLANQFEPLLPAAPNTVSQCATVGFVNDHELGTAMFEVSRPTIRLDEVGRDDGEAVPVEYRNADRQI